MNKQPIVVEKTYDANRSTVWRALTDKNEMKKWYFDLEEFKAEPGFAFTFSAGPSPELQYVHFCEVIEVIPEQKLSYSWRYEGYPGNSIVSFDLSDKGDKTILKLTHEGVESFPEENNDLSRSKFEEGWNQILNSSLEKYIRRREGKDAK